MISDSSGVKPEHQTQVQWHVLTYGDKLPPLLAVLLLKLRDTYTRNAENPPRHGTQGKTVTKHRNFGAKGAYVRCEYQLLHEVETLLGLEHEELFKRKAVAVLQHLAEAHDGIRR